MWVLLLRLARLTANSVNACIDSWLRISSSMKMKLSRRVNSSEEPGVIGLTGYDKEAALLPGNAELDSSHGIRSMDSAA